MKKFTTRDIVNKNFASKNSSILRILTKWSEYLEGIFENPDTYISRRVYEFKDFRNNLIEPNQDLEEELIRRINLERPMVKSKTSKLKEVYNTFSSYFLCKKTDTSPLYSSRY